MKRVLITGATSGIGQQLAIDYLTEGWEVIACGRDGEKLRELEHRHDRMETRQFDMTDLDATRRALTSTTADLVILCAGTCEYLDNGVVDAALIQRVLTTNVMGPIHCLDVLLPQLLAGSRVALVGSTACLVPLPRAEAYGASKAALAYFARSLSLDLVSRGISISLVMPGFVSTPLTAHNDFPMPMLITPERASAYIRRGLAQGRREVVFPPLFAAILHTVALLPRSWQHFLGKRLSR